MQQRPGAATLVVPMMPTQTLVRGAVRERELAVSRVRGARERRVRAEERGDPHGGEATVGRTGRSRVERSARDRPAQPAVELAVLAGGHGLAVGAPGLAGAGALTVLREERAVVAPDQVVAAVPIPLDLERPLLGVRGPRVPTGAGVVGHDGVGPKLAVLWTAVAVVREACGREREGAGQYSEDDPTPAHISRPSRLRRLHSLDAAWEGLLRSAR